jgi:hypothetical protein
MALARWLDLHSLNQASWRYAHERVLRKARGTILDPLRRSPPTGMPPKIAPCTITMLPLDSVWRHSALARVVRREVGWVFVLYAAPRRTTIGVYCEREWITEHRVRSPWPARAP